MTRKHVSLMLLYILLAFTAVPAAHAQGTADINFQDILNALGPRTGTDLMFDILLYIIFFLGFINMFLISDKQLVPSLLNFAVMGMAIISKLLVGTQTSPATISPTDLPVLVLNVGMFTIPLIIAGMLRATKGKPPKAMIPSIIMGLVGGGYFFLFWAFEQRGG